ncbi:hypothetical protein [Enterobacter hormaechei]|uniref:hypothetical protein n=1 Tax=Enterobacter hormaechei TaxID=158836 RepID=UPI0030CA38C5
MSRSRRKTPIVGHTTCGSEREDKKLWHQRWRTRERTALTSASPEALSAHLPLLENQASSVWSMGKGSAWKTESMVTPVFATPILTTSWLA